MSNRRRTASIVSLPPPIGGWNRRDPLPTMKPEDAIVLENMIPGVGDVSLRRGFAPHVPGLGTYIESLMEYSAIDGTNKLFAATPTDVYNVTAVTHYRMVLSYTSFTCTAANATIGATYVQGDYTFTVMATIAGATTLVATGTGTPSASGTLTKATGTGDTTITYSAFTSGTTASATSGATYTNNGNTFTVITTIASGTSLHMSGTGDPAIPADYGTLTKASGTGDATIYFSSYTDSVGAAAFGSMTNGRWQHVMFGTAAGNYLVMCNGADAVRNFDGTSWTTPTLTKHTDDTGTLTTSANFIQVCVHGSRLWFVEKNTLKAWYLPVTAISGSGATGLKHVSLSSYCKLGGYLMVMGTWTRDGGSGPDDLAIFITSKGETVIFSGVDPATWSMVGVFRIADPIGRRCLMKAGSDLAIITVVGLTPLSQVLVANVSGQSLATVTNKIGGAFMETSYGGSGYHGWQAFEYPRGNLVIINVPISERVTQHQYIANVLTGAWAKWTGMDAGCWSLMGTDLYFGGNDGTVYKYGDDYNDDGDTISAVVQQAYSNMGVNETKRFISARPLVRTPAGYNVTVNLKTNYDSSAISVSGTSSTTNGSFWNVALWNETYWNGTSTPSSGWQSIGGLGVTASIAMTISLSQEFTLNQIDVMFERGNYF